MFNYYFSEFYDSHIPLSIGFAVMFFLFLLFITNLISSKISNDEKWKFKEFIKVFFMIGAAVIVSIFLLEFFIYSNGDFTKLTIKDEKLILYHNTKPWNNFTITKNDIKEIVVVRINSGKKYSNYNYHAKIRLNSGKELLSPKLDKMYDNAELLLKNLGFYGIKYVNKDLASQDTEILILLRYLLYGAGGGLFCIFIILVIVFLVNIIAKRK